MKTVTIRFEFPDWLEHQEVIDVINGSIYDMERELAHSINYTILERATNGKAKEV